MDSTVAFIPASGGTPVTLSACPVCGNIRSNEAQHLLTDPHKLAVAASERRSR